MKNIDRGNSLITQAKFLEFSWNRRSVVVIITVQPHATKSKLRLCSGLNPACGVSKVCDDESLWQWFQLKIRVIVFCRSPIPQKQLIIIIIIFNFEKTISVVGKTSEIKRNT